MMKAKEYKEYFYITKVKKLDTNFYIPIVREQNNYLGEVWGSDRWTRERVIGWTSMYYAYKYDSRKDAERAMNEYIKRDKELYIGEYGWTEDAYDYNRPPLRVIGVEIDCHCNQFGMILNP